MQDHSDRYRQAWRKFPTGVSVVTTRTAEGEPYATTANALLSISLDPMLLLLSVATAGHTCANLRREGRFAVNFLRDDQSEIADFYGRAPWEDRQRLPDAHVRHESGPALLNEALVRMVCRIDQQVEAGDHTLFIAEVEEVDVQDGEALVFYEGRYGTVSGA